MSENEILKMAAFKVHSCASRFQKLTREAKGTPLADHFATIAGELLELEASLLKRTLGGTDRGNGLEVRTPSRRARSGQR